MTTIEKIKAEIKRQIHLGKNSIASLGDMGQSSIINALEELLSFIESLEKEQPQGLDETARQYLLHEHNSYLTEIMHQAGIKAESMYHEDIENAFKAGAEWQREQGETIEGSLCYGPHLQKVIVFLENCPKMWKGSTMDVTVQIRKKDGNKV